MNFGEILAQFKTVSGRFDLVKEDGTDNGASFYINAGQRILDSRFRIPKSKARHQEDVAADVYNLAVENILAIHNVWVSYTNDTGDIVRSELEKTTLNYLKTQYPEDWEIMDGGLPLYYANNVIGLSPQQSDLTVAGGANPYTTEFTYEYGDLVFGDHFNKSGIIWMPPTDRVYTVQILADFFSKQFDGSTIADENWWTIVHPDILIDSAMMVVEVTLRNTEGVKDWLGAIDIKMLGVEKDVAEQEQVGYNQMQG